MDTRKVIRKATRHGLAISTIHPTYGELHRGTITQYPTPPGQICGTWQVDDQDGCDCGRIVDGDYVQAERMLLDATTWADEPA